MMSTHGELLGDGFELEYLGWNDDMAPADMDATVWGLIWAHFGDVIA